MAGQSRKRPGEDDSDTYGREAPEKRLRQLISENDPCPIAPDNEVYNRYVFNSRRQRAGESSCEFLSALSRLSEGCNYRQLRDTMIVDFVIIGVKDDQLRSRLLHQDQPLTLDRCRELCESHDRKEKEHSAPCRRQERQEEAPATSDRRGTGCENLGDDTCDAQVNHSELKPDANVQKVDVMCECSASERKSELCSETCGQTSQALPHAEESLQPHVDNKSEMPPRTGTEACSDNSNSLTGSADSKDVVERQIK